MNGSQLRDIRIFNKQTQAQFAKLLGITAPHLSKVENGHEPLSRNVIVRLAQQYDLTEEYLEAIRRQRSFFDHLQ